MTTYIMSNTGTGVLSEDLERIVTPPKWLYYLCGAPKPKGYPPGTMRVVAFRAQILGVILMVYLIYSKIWETTQLENLIALSFGLLLALVMTSYVARNYQARSRTLKKNKNT